MLSHPLLGVGIGQQRWNWPPSVFGDLLPDPEIADPIPIHNSYLLVGIETGVGGLLVLLAILAVAMRESRRLSIRFRRQGDSELADASLAICAGIAGMALAMLLYPMTETFRYFWLLIGLTASLVRIESQMQPGDLNRSTE
jgi:O-antigen ligase